MTPCGRTSATGSGRSATSPRFTRSPILTLALGIGAATTIFSVIQNVLLDPFPYKDAERVAAIRIHDATNPQPCGRPVLQTPEFLDYMEQNHVFEEVIGGTPEDVLDDHGGGHRAAHRRRGDRRTRSSSSACSAILGRALTPADAAPGAPPVFVMAHKMWVKHFNSDPAVVGRTLCSTACPRRSSASCRRASRSSPPIYGGPWR